MAQDDIKPYEEKKAEIENAVKVAKEVFPLLRSSNMLADWLRSNTLYSSHTDEQDAKRFEEQQQKDLKKLELYMHCAHIETREEDDGHDSHKDYYKLVCKKCGKTMKTWSI